MVIYVDENECPNIEALKKAAGAGTIIFDDVLTAFAYQETVYRLDKRKIYPDAYTVENITSSLADTFLHSETVIQYDEVDSVIDGILDKLSDEAVIIVPEKKQVIRFFYSNNNLTVDDYAEAEKRGKDAVGIDYNIWELNDTDPDDVSSVLQLTESEDAIYDGGIIILYRPKGKSVSSPYRDKSDILEFIYDDPFLDADTCKLLYVGAH